MNLAIKFNDSYRASKGADLAVALYAAFNYGSDAFCFDQMARLTHHANDSGSAAPQPLVRGL